MGIILFYPYYLQSNLKQEQGLTMSFQKGTSDTEKVQDLTELKYLVKLDKPPGS